MQVLVAGPLPRVDERQVACVGSAAVPLHVLRVVVARGGAMAAPWQPSEGGVQKITQLLHEYLQPGADQARVFQELEQCKQFPDFNNYLTFVLCHGNTYSVQVRQSAGLLLKNNVRSWEGTDGLYRNYIRTSLLHCLRSNEKMLRQTAGQQPNPVEAASLP